MTVAPGYPKKRKGYIFHWKGEDPIKGGVGLNLEGRQHTSVHYGNVPVISDVP